MPSAKKNKFDPEEPKSDAELVKCGDAMNLRSESFAIFCRRMLGTSEDHPLIFAGEPLNGASLAAMVAAFKECAPIAKGEPVPEGLPARRAAMQSQTMPAEETPQ